MRRVRIKLPEGKRVVSGPLQFNDDPPGVYLNLIDAVFLRRVLMSSGFASKNPTLQKSLDRFIEITGKVVNPPGKHTE